MEPLLIIAAIIALLAVIIVVKSVALVPQAEAAVVERLGRYTKTVSGQLLFLMPFVILMIWLMVPWLERSIASGERSMNAGGLILWPAKALLLAGFVLLFFQGLSEIIKKIAIMRGLIADPHAESGPHGAAEVVIDPELLAETGFASPDHPVTGGYPVIGVVVAADIGRAAQAQPGQRLRFEIEGSVRRG